MTRVAAAVLILAALNAPALAADVAGKWTGSNKYTTLTFTFNQEGSRLAGTVQEASTGETAAITDGRTDGDRLSFTVRLGDEIRFLCDGTVKGDEIYLVAKANGVGVSGGGSGTLKRVK